MAWVTAGPVSALPAGEMMEAEVNGATYAICNNGDAVYAIDGICPHLGGRLAHGALHESTVVCPWHAWEFDCRTGVNVFLPEVKLATFPVEVREGSILIDAPL